MGTATGSKAKRAYSNPHYAAAWGVHLLTGLGAVFGLLALSAVMDENWSVALLWLAVAFVVDGIDGPLARVVRVTQVLPRVDGTTLDLIVDYLTYVIVPGAFLLRSPLLPEPLRIVLAAAVLLSAQYHFVRTDIKTKDNYFQGFPAVWNLVVFYLFVVDAPPWTNGVVVGFLVLLTFTSTKWVHPFRVRKLWPLSPIIAALWFASSLVALLSLPAKNWPAVSLSLLSAGYFVLLSGLRTLGAGRVNQPSLTVGDTLQ